MSISISQIIDEVEFYLYYKHYDRTNLSFEEKETKTQIKVIAYDTHTGAIVETITLKKRDILKDPVGVYEEFKNLKERAKRELYSA
jgi:hypothetical protein